jgi:hypothetical protein
MTRLGLWGLAPPVVTSCQSHPNRAQDACIQLIASWRGMRVSDGYLVSQYGPGLHQGGLAPLLRTAPGRLAPLAPGLASFGQQRCTELPRLGSMVMERPTVEQGRAWDARCPPRRCPRAPLCGHG